jgi:endothelin-converting enzyme/putative endopeptidase
MNPEFEKRKYCRLTRLHEAIVFKRLVSTVLVTALCVSPFAAQAQHKSLPGEDRLPGLDTTLIDRTADPCTDFFQYACGNFAKLHPIPADRSSFGLLIMMGEYNQRVLYSMLEGAADTSRPRTSNEQKIGDFYASCMDVAAIKQKGLEPLQPELDRIAAVKSKDGLAELLAHDQLIGVNAFLSFGEAQDFKDAGKQIAILDQGGLGLPEKDYYLRKGEAAERTRSQYVRHIANMMRLLGEPQANAEHDAERVMASETTLAEVSMDVTSQRDPNNVYHMVPVSQLARLAPNVAWNRFFVATGAPGVAELNVANPDFLKGLNALIGSTDLDTIKTYLRWQLINATPGQMLPQALDDEKFDFYGRKLKGQPEQRVRWKRCVNATDTALGEALGEVYVRQEFLSSSKKGTLDMVHDIEAALDQDIDSLDWMSQATKIKAKQKLSAVANKIGYPERWRDYSELSVIRGDAFGNATRATEFENRRQLAKIGKPVDRGDWDMSPPTVNAYYNPSMNDINFPAGILQPPLFRTKSTDAENYGHIGAVIGHELTHGFDDEGHQFDLHGNLSDWWTADDAKKFAQRLDCEVKEYDGFTAVDDLKVNGKLTLGENTADNGGLRLAYMAFLADAKRKMINTAKARDGFTSIEQFFLAYAQNWCDTTRPEQLRLQVQTNPHSPEQFRVNGVVRNMPEFGKAFGCKLGQPMMPENVCRVW